MTESIVRVAHQRAALLQGVLDHAVADIGSAAGSLGPIPGAVALAISAGEIVFQGAAGTRCADGVTAMTTDSVFNIASMTKAITATACMRLVEQRRIGLDDDVGSVVPALAAPRVLDGFDPDGLPVLRPARRPVTLRHLMTHTSGLSYETWSPVILRYMRHTGHSRLDMFRSVENCMPLAFDPGDRWSYGFGLEWTGKLIEALTGHTLEEELHEQIFAPLGMASTGFRVTPDMEARLVQPFQRHPEGGTLTALDLPPPTDPAAFMGGGGLHSTAGDYGRFLLMLLGGGALGGARLLQPETVSLMGQNHIGTTDVTPMVSTIPAMSRDVELFPGLAKRWGLSFMINTEDAPGRRRAGSLSWAGLRNTYYWLDPASKVAGVVMTQILPFADPAALRLLETFETAVYATEP